MQTGSLVNNLMGQTSTPEPEVGMGATKLCWTDRHAYTIIEVSPDKRRCTIQRDTATRTDKLGMSDSQDYEYTPDPNGQTVQISLRKTGTWHMVGQTTRSEKYALGFRHEYHDYSF